MHRKKVQKLLSLIFVFLMLMTQAAPMAALAKEPEQDELLVSPLSKEDGQSVQPTEETNDPPVETTDQEASGVDLDKYTDYEGYVLYRKNDAESTGGIVTRDVSTGTVVVKYAGDMQQYLSRKAGLKYVDSDTGNIDLDGRWRMVYCLYQPLPTPEGEVSWNPNKSVSQQVIYIMAYGVRYWGEPSVYSGYRTGDWKRDYYACQMAIHVVQGEFTADSLGNADPTVRALVDKLVADAKNPAMYTAFDGSKYNDVQYSVTPSHQETWIPYTHNGVSGYATQKSFKQNISDKYGDRPEWLKKVKATMTGAPSGVELVWKDKSNASGFWLFAPTDVYNQMKIDQPTITVTVNGQLPNYLSGWYYEPLGDWQPVSLFEPSWANDEVIASVTVSVKGETTEEKEGIVSVRKTDAETGAFLSEAVFEVYEWNGADWSLHSRLTEYTSDGIYRCDQLKITDTNGGRFKVIEAQPPAGYIQNDPRWEREFVLTDSALEFTFDVTNGQGKGKIQLQKTNAKPELGDYSLAGAKFAIKNTATGEIIHITTNESGYAETGELPLGEYEVYEVEAPVNMTINPTVFKVSLMPNGSALVTQRVEVPEEPQSGKIKLNKFNANPDFGDFSLAGAVFEVKDSNGTVVDSIKTDSNGYGESKSLPFGKYTVQEKNAPHGYVINKNVLDVTLSSTGENISYAEVTVPQEPQKGRIKFTKLDDRTGKTPHGDATLNGMIIGIYDKATGELVEEVHAPADSNVVESGLLKIETTYVCRELVPPLGYTLSQTAYEITIPYAGQEVEVNLVSQDVENKVIEGKIHLTKYFENPPLGESTENKQIKTPGRQIEFEIRLKSSGEVYETIKTDENGFAESKWLPYGRYIVTELPSTANEGYKLVPPFEVMIDFDDMRTYYYILKNDTICQPIRLVKEDVDTDRQVPLAGFKFQIRDALGEIVKFDMLYPEPYKLDVFETTANGEVWLPELLQYGKYTLEEIEAVEPYLLNSEPIPFEVKDQTGETVVVVCQNKEVMGTIEIEKTGEVLVGIKEVKTDHGTMKVPVYEQRPVTGITFDIIAKEDIIAPDGTIHAMANQVVDTLITGEKNITDQLHLGAYLVIERDAGDNGLVLDTEQHEVTLAYKDQHTAIIAEKLNLKNKRQTVDLELIKKAEVFNVEKGEFILQPAKEGFVFGVFANQNIADYQGNTLIKQDELLAIITTDKDGKAAIQDDSLPLALLYVKELKAPSDGWDIPDTRYAVDATYSDQTLETVEVVVNEGKAIINKLLRKQIKYIKLDERHSERRLEGSVLEIRDADGNVVATIITDENGVATSGELPYGEYELEEIKPPKGFALDGEVKKVVLDDAGDAVVIYEKTNKPTKVIIEKTDILDEKPVPGAEITIENSDGSEYGKWITPEDGRIVIEEIPAGDYVYYESITVPGYTFNTERYNFTVNDDGTISGDCAIKNTPTSLEVIKKDGFTDQPMVAEFKVTSPDGKVLKFSKLETGQYVPNDDGEEIIQTDEEGKLTVLYLQMKDKPYSIEEANVVDGFVPGQKVEFSITQENGMDNPAKAEYINKPTAIELTKKDAYDEQPMEVGFKVIGADGKVAKFIQLETGEYKYSAEGEDVIHTSGDGKLKAVYLPLSNAPYSFEEVEKPAGYGIAEALQAELKEENTYEQPLLVSVKNQPLALNILKVDGNTKAALDAGFVIMTEQDKTALKFTLVSDGVYMYDIEGKEKTLYTSTGKIQILYLPEDTYYIEETKVAKGYFPAAPVKITLGTEHTLDAPLEVTIENFPSVKLGMDSDKWLALIGIGIALAIVGIVGFRVLRKRRG